MASIKCVLFDCDGTLVDSERLCCLAIVETFEQVGVKLRLDAVMDNFTGGKIADVLSSAQELAGSHVSLDLLEPIYREQTQRLFEEQLKPMDGAIELLDFLDQSGIEYCVVTNSPIQKAKKMLATVGLEQRFRNRIISAFDANSWKPEPDLLQYAVTMMGFLPDECLYIDDTSKGVKMGVNAGIQTIHFVLSCDYQQNSSTCLTSMSEVIKHIEKAE
jgi:HAD superfamily hydrolase (TIGR01509 family)